jgi:hypothetical protein
MTISEFVSASNLLDRLEIEKAILLAFYYLRSANRIDFSVDDVAIWFSECHLPRPNLSRLRLNLAKHGGAVRGSTPTSFRLHAKEIARLDQEFPLINKSSEDVVSHEWVLPEAVWTGSRGFIETLARQINACYEHNIFDGCAVLMRRLLEVCLILSYQHLGLESEIKDSQGNFVLLDAIVSNAKSNTKLSLSRNTKTSLDDIRKLGNFSAHKIHYTCRREDIRRVLLDFRVTIEELLYKAGVKR